MNIVECIANGGSHDVKEESYLTNGGLFLHAVVMLNLISIRLRK